MNKIDEIEFMKNFITSLKELGYSDWWIGDKTALAFRVLEIVEEERTSDETGDKNEK